MIEKGYIFLAGLKPVLNLTKKYISYGFIEAFSRKSESAKNLSTKPYDEYLFKTFTQNISILIV